jgi:hypothetical protein
VLNPNSETGRHKALVIQSALGFDRGNADEFVAQIRGGLLSNPAIERQADGYGRRFSVEIPMTGPAGSATVTTGWIIRSGENVPDLTTVYIEKRRQKP